VGNVLWDDSRNLSDTRLLSTESSCINFGD